MLRRSRSVRIGFPSPGRARFVRVVAVLLLSIASASVPARSIRAAEGRARETVAFEPLAVRLDALLARGLLSKASVGIWIERVGSGDVVYARGGDQLFIPASNQKILTAIASLARFGPAHRFATRVWAPEPVDGEGEVRELVVEGGGDPLLRSEDWWRIAADLRTAGLRVVRGDIRVEDGLFEGPAWHPSWGDVTARAYHAPVGALTANQGIFAVSIRPRAAAGSAARVALDPPVDYLRLRNLARTVAPRARPSLSIERIAGAGSEEAAEEIVRVEGRVRLGDPGDLFARSVLDPGLYAGSLLHHQLEANGIAVDGVVRRAPRSREPFALILERVGGSVAEIVRFCLKQSSNSVAEALVKNLGAWTDAAPGAGPARRGEWVGGIRALRRELEALGIDLGAARLVDGSGLSLQNRLSPRMIVEALRVARASFEIGPELVSALPIAHRDGTLERRLERAQGRIRAKTGLLTDAGVTALSGYAERSDGETLIFSILVNGPGGGGEAGMAAVDRLAETLLEAPLPAPPAAPDLESPESEPAPGRSGAGDQEARVAPAGWRTKARITESMYSEGSLVPSRSRRSITPGPQL